MSDQESHLKSAFFELFQTVQKLRAPGGCPWDRAQTHQSLRPFVIEEAYEVLDVLDEIESSESLQKPDIKNRFKEELGDLLMQVMLHSEMTREAGSFDVSDVAKTLNEKLIRRHPHVFATEKAANADEALKNWETQKLKEKKSDGTEDARVSVLSGIPKSLPSLQKATRIIEKVTKVGFQWSDLNGPLQKLDEEVHEFKTELKKSGATPDISPEQKQKISQELGDLFFSLCNIAYFYKISPEDSLREMLGRFQSRFQYIESRLAEKGKTPSESNLDEMDTLWNEAKESLKKP